MQAFIETLKASADPISTIKAAGLYPKFAAGGIPTRILITHNRLGETSGLAAGANGVVYDAVTKSVLCVPGMSLTYSPTPALITAALSTPGAKVYEAADGTTVNLYYDGSAWCMGTIHAWDVSSYTWIGAKTYREQFEETAKLYGWNWDQLDKTLTYTVGFRCADFHALRFDPPRCWLISAQSTVTMETVVVDTKLPLQVEVPVDVTAAKASATRLIDSAAGAYSDFVYSIRSNQRTIPINYGYIVKTPTQSLFIESSLMKRVRLLLYNFPKSGIVLDNRNRQQYVLLKAYLNYLRVDEFLLVFPQFKQQFETFTSFFNTLTDRVVEMLRNRNSRKSETKLDTLALSFALGPCKTETLNPMSSSTADIVRQYVYDQARIGEYMAALSEYVPAAKPRVNAPSRGGWLRGAGGAKKRG